jgi:ferric-dicitrate binding protein FerR (iron transport regulator)
MTNRGRKSADDLLLEALRAHRPDVPELGPSRLELERRRLMARLAAVGSERGVARLGGLGTRWIAAAAAAAVVALALAVALLASRSGGDAVTLSGEWKVEPGDAIASGALIAVPRGARASLVLADGTRIWADGGARVRLVEGAGLGVELVGGRIAAEVAKRPPAAGAFAVSTEFGTVSVTGTVFTVAVAKDDMIVRLYEGRVRLAAAGRSVSLSPGRSARATRAGIAALAAVPEAERRADLAFVGDEIPRLAAATIIAPKPAAGAAKPELEPTLPAADAAEPELETILPAADAAEPELETIPPAAGAAEPEDRLIALWRAARYAEIVALTDGPGTPPAALFHRGKALAALGRWAEAGAAYAGAAAGGGELAGEALYLSAAAHQKAGDLPESLAMSERAAARGGPNADHASRLVFIAQLGLGRYADAGRSASGYLAAFPEGAHVAEARFVLGTGLRLSKSWAAAAVAYADFAALGRGEPQMRDDAAFYVGYCQLMAGSAAEGKKNLELYLASNPSGRHVEQARAALSN